jgi:hypothetical protein
MQEKMRGEKIRINTYILLDNAYTVSVLVVNHSGVAGPQR